MFIAGILDSTLATLLFKKRFDPTSWRKMWLGLQKIPRSWALSSTYEKVQRLNVTGRMIFRNSNPDLGFVSHYKNIYSLKKYTNVKYYIFYYIPTYFPSMPFGFWTKSKGRIPFISLATLYAIFLLPSSCIFNFKHEELVVKLESLGTDIIAVRKVPLNIFS